MSGFCFCLFGLPVGAAASVWVVLLPTLVGRGSLLLYYSLLILVASYAFSLIRLASPGGPTGAFYQDAVGFLSNRPTHSLLSLLLLLHLLLALRGAGGPPACCDSQALSLALLLLTLCYIFFYCFPFFGLSVYAFYFYGYCGSVCCDTPGGLSLYYT